MFSWLLPTMRVKASSRSPRRSGNGEDPQHNLYWGSAFGVKTFFSRSSEWKLLWSGQHPKPEVLRRCVFKYRTANVYFVADAYRGRKIQTAMLDFLDSASGLSREQIKIHDGQIAQMLDIRGGSQLVAYVGHDGLMDAPLSKLPRQEQYRSSRGNRLSLWQQDLLRSPAKRVRRLPVALDHGSDGARSIHPEKRARWMDPR
jgi:hypothetical protein